MQVVLQATVCDCLALDPFAFEEDGLSASEVDVSRGKIVEALVIAGMVVMRHEGGDLAFEIAGQVVVLKQDCPSSDDLRHIAGLQKGGSGSSVIEIMRHAGGAARASSR